MPNLSLYSRSNNVQSVPTPKTVSLTPAPTETTFQRMTPAVNTNATTNTPKPATSGCGCGFMPRRR
jgi:hypothetical protein